MTVYCVNSDTTYADITAADAAESGIDYGVPTRFEQSGVSSASVVFSDSDYPSSIIYTANSGEETDGTTSTGAQCTGTINTSVSGGVISNLRTGRVLFSNALNHYNENLVSDGGGGDVYIFGTVAATSTNCIRYNCSEGCRANAINDSYIETNCTVVDATGFGVLRPRAVASVSLNTASSAYLQLGASSANYWADDGTGSDAITETTKTDIFENYATGDYRIKPTSSVGAAGAGAFINSGGGGTVITPTGIASTSAVGTPTIINLHQVLAPTGIVSGESFGSATVMNSQVLQPTSVSSLEALGSPVILTGAITLGPSGIASEEASGTPSLTYAQLVSVTGIGSAEMFGLAIVQDGIEVVIPITNRRTYQEIQAYLKTTGKFVSRDNNGILLEWLRKEGVDATQLNDAFFKYWEGKGYTGAYNDKWKKWRG